MKMKKFFEAACIGMKNGFLGILPMFAWLASCLIFAFMIFGIFYLIDPVYFKEENNVSMMIIFSTLIGVGIGSFVYAFVVRVKDAVKISNETGMSMENAWRESGKDSCGEFL